MDVSPLTLNRISVYLRCLRRLHEDGVSRISSQQLARKFHLSATQIRKDLTQLGGSGIRGVGYEVQPLIRRLTGALGLDQKHSLAVVGMGAMGSAFTRHIGFNQGSFQVAAGFDHDAAKIGQKVGDIVVKPTSAIGVVIPQLDIKIGIIAVPREAAQDLADRLVAAGTRSILNFAPVRLESSNGVHIRNVDVRIYLEELVFYLGADER